MRDMETKCLFRLLGLVLMSFLKSVSMFCTAFLVCARGGRLADDELA